MNSIREGEKEGRSTGLEPATSGSTNLHSNQLSYDRHNASHCTQGLFFRQFELEAPGRFFLSSLILEIFKMDGINL